MDQVIAYKKKTRYQRIIIPILYLIMFLSLAVPAFSYYSGFTSYLTVGTDPAEFTVGQDSAIFTVGVGSSSPTPESSTNPIDSYIAVKPILLIIPGLLLLSFIIWFSYIGFKNIRQSQVVQGLTYLTISFVLVGITLSIGMPIILDGINSTMWFK